MHKTDSQDWLNACLFGSMPASVLSSQLNAQPPDIAQSASVCSLMSDFLNTNHCCYVLSPAHQAFQASWINEYMTQAWCPDVAFVSSATLTFKRASFTLRKVDGIIPTNFQLSKWFSVQPYIFFWNIHVFHLFNPVCTYSMQPIAIRVHQIILTACVWCCCWKV